MIDGLPLAPRSLGLRHASAICRSLGNDQLRTPSQPRLTTHAVGARQRPAGDAELARNLVHRIALADPIRHQLDALVLGNLCIGDAEPRFLTLRNLDRKFLAPGGVALRRR